MERGSSRDIRSSWFKATDLLWLLNKGAPWWSWAFPCVQLSAPRRQLGLQVASEREAWPCAFSVSLQSSPRGALETSSQGQAWGSGSCYRGEKWHCRS